VAQVFTRVEVYHMWLVPGLRSVETPVKRAAKRVGARLHLVPHWHLAEILAKGVYGPCRGIGRVRVKLGQKDLERQLRRETGIRWVAYGHRMADGASRRFYLREHGGVDHEHGRLTPIYDWSTSNVWRYLHGRGVQAPRSQFGRQHWRMSGFHLDIDCIRWLSENHPDDYERVKDFFPHIEVLLARDHMFPAAKDGGRGEPRPEEPEDN
jgi:hypothetical protein